jgi:UDP-N-acetylmuramoylalanine--D-glutamate ligase
MYQNKKISILGLGKSGKSAIEFLSRKGALIFVSEIDLKSKDYLEKLKFDKKIVDYEIGEHSQKILDSDLIVASPGVNTNLDIFKKINAKNIEVISELELGYRSLKTKNIIAVTGTNGKTTTVNILYYLLKNFGKDAFLCGNVGTPITEIAELTTENNFVVIEASSYQLELVNKFHAKKATVLNVTPDHLYRYRDMQHYAQTKFNIFLNQNPQDVALINLDDEYCKTLAKKINSKVKTFSLKDKNADIYYSDGKIFFKKLDWQFDTTKLFILGLHNVQNVMSSVLLLEDVVKNNLDLLDNLLIDFKGLEHRLEFVAEINGVKYINDSKSTNTDSTEVALKSFDDKKNVILILGGIHKGYSFESLASLINPKVKKLILFGEAKDRIAEELKKFVDIIDIQNDLENSVKSANKNAIIGDVVLLSPGCASFDQFQNFEHRGNIFKEFVKK